MSWITIAIAAVAFLAWLLPMLLLLRLCNLLHDQHRMLDTRLADVARIIHATSRGLPYRH